MKRALLYFCLAFASLIAPVSAQLSNESGPVRITADRLDVLQDEGKAIYAGGVKAVQGGATIQAEQLTIFFEEAGNTAGSDPVSRGLGRMRSMLAEGDVQYDTGNEIVRGSLGFYDYLENTITVTGGVTVERGSSNIRGDAMVIDLETGVSRFTSRSRVRTEAFLDNPRGNERTGDE